MVNIGVEVEVKVFVGSINYDNLLCSGVYSSEDGGQTVDVYDREIGEAGRIAIISDYDVNTIIEAALNENDVDFSEPEITFLISEYSAQDIADGVVSVEDAGYTAKLVTL